MGLGVRTDTDEVFYGGKSETLISTNNLPSWWPNYHPYIIIDCIESMRKIPNKAIDLILTDPPYGIGESNEKNASRGKLVPTSDFGHYEWDKERITAEYFKEMMRISKHQVIFGGNYYIDYLQPGPSWVIWDKDNGGCDFADCEMAWTSHNKAVRKFTWKWHGAFQQRRDFRKEKRLHPTQKPVALFEWILKNYSDEGNIIFDPFLGSGTTLLACERTNRIGLGCEINPDYEILIKKRAKLDTTRLSDFPSQTSEKELRN